MTNPDISYMRRALQLAQLGAGHVSPNPMVGAVVVARDRIIGEGWHRRFGGPHAEVNAIASVAPNHIHLLPEATIYVTLEPCSHWGKTPPCANLIIEKGLRRVVAGAPDPNPLVSGRGFRLLREAGVEVTDGVLVAECMALNSRFMTAHTLGRPHITLKWAQSRDGFIGAFNADGSPCPVALSDSVSRLHVHSLRSMCDAILAGTGTIIADNPRLDNRLWPGNSPRIVAFESPRLPSCSNVALSNPIMLDPSLPLEENMALLRRDHGVTSLLVEGGASLLGSFIGAGLYDQIRVETAPATVGSGVKAPALPDDAVVEKVFPCGGSSVSLYVKKL